MRVSSLKFVGVHIDPMELQHLGGPTASSFVWRILKNQPGERAADRLQPLIHVCVVFEPDRTYPGHQVFKLLQEIQDAEVKDEQTQREAFTTGQ